MLIFRVIFGFGLLAAVVSTAAGQPFFASGSEPLHIPVVIELPEEVRINAERMYLGDITNCSGYELYCEEAYSVDLGAAPEPGGKVTVRLDQIKALLAKEWPLAIIDYVGRSKVTVDVEAAWINSDQVAGEFLAVLSPVFDGQREYRFRVERVQVPANVKVLPGEYELIAHDLQTTQGKTLEWVVNRISGSKRYRFSHRPLIGSEETEFHVRANIVVERSVPVAARRLERGHSVRHEDLTSNWIPQTKLRRGILVSESDIIGRSVKHSITVGHAIQRNAVEVPLAVKRGQELTIVVKKGKMVLTRHGKALQGGRIGEVIPLEMSSRQKVKAKILTADRAEFLF